MSKGEFFVLVVGICVVIGVSKMQSEWHKGGDGCILTLLFMGAVLGLIAGAIIGGILVALGTIIGLFN